MNNIKILIADDEKDILEIMARKIGREGFDVHTAVNGKEALLKIQTALPDVVVLDLTMPEKDGWSVLEEIRKNPPGGKWIPVIIVSALGEMKDLQRGMTLQADHYLVKPCSVEEILKGIRLMLALLPQRKISSES